MRYHEIRALVEHYNATKRASPKGKRLDNNTYAVALGDDRYAIRLHETNIVIFNPDNTIELHTGGWQTATTKDRMCKYAGVRMWQEENVWFIRMNEQTSIMFHTGLVIVPTRNTDFDCLNSGSTIPGVNDTPKNVLKTKRGINAYIVGYIDALMQGNVPTPSMGDCWLCLADKNDMKFDNCGHILSHIDEMYFVPTLSVTALKYACAGDNAIGWLFSKMKKEGSSSFWDSVMPRTLKTAMRKMMYKYVGISF